MTTPGTVAGQAAAPSAGIGAVRDTAAKSGSGAQTADGEDGFGDVLSELQRGDSDEPALSKDHPRAGERTNARRHDVEAQLNTEGGRADPNVGSETDFSDNDLQLASEPHLKGAEPVQSGVALTPALGLDATLAGDIAAVLPPNLVQPSAQGTPDAPRLLPTGRQTSGSTAAVGETIGERSQGPEAPVRLQVEGKAQGALDNLNSRQLAAASEPILANPRGTTVDKDRFERAGGQTSVTATDLSTPPDENGTAALAQRLEIPAPTHRPKANVLRQETHFAPVSTSTVGPQGGGSAEDAGKSLPVPEAHGGESAGAPSVVAAVSSFEDSSSIAMPLAQQIADRVAAEATSASESAERTGLTPAMQQGFKPALKILQIQLQPADLGTVTVHMELKNTELTLHVEADRKETADLIRNDQDALTNLLRSAGYNVDTGSVRIMEGDRTLASQQFGQQSTQANLQSSTQSQSGASDRQGHAQRGGAGTDGGDTGNKTGRNDTNETTANRAGRGVYV